jgi:hypothetical protein
MSEDVNQTPQPTKKQSSPNELLLPSSPQTHPLPPSHPCLNPLNHTIAALRQLLS